MQVIAHFYYQSFPIPQIDDQMSLKLEDIISNLLIDTKNAHDALVGSGAQTPLPIKSSGAEFRYHTHVLDGVRVPTFPAWHRGCVMFGCEVVAVCLPPSTRECRYHGGA